MTPLVRYGVAVAAPSLALTAALALRPVADAAAFPLLLAGVVLVARYMGAWPGLLATALSTAALDYFFLMPEYTLAIASANALVDLAVFALVATLVSTLSQRLTRARSQAEQTLQDLEAVIEAADDGVVVFGVDGQVQHANRWFRAWWLVHYGLVPSTTEELLRTVRQAAPGTASADGLMPIGLALRGMHASEALTLRTNEGERRVHLRASPMVDEAGAVRGVVSVWHDITEVEGPRAHWSRLGRPSTTTAQN